MVTENKIPSAFISHKSSDAKFAKKLASDLRKKGVFTWLDVWNMPPGKALSDAMQEGIDNCNIMVLILSPESVESIHMGTGGVSFEVHIGEGRKFGDKDYRILGVLFKDCNPPEKLKNRIGRWLDFRNEHQYSNNILELSTWIKNESADLGPPVITGQSPLLNIDYTSEECFLEIYRERGLFSGIGVTLRISLDGDEVAQLTSGKSVKIIVSPGEHAIEAKHATSWHKSSCRINVRRGENRRVKCGFSLTSIILTPQ